MAPIYGDTIVFDQPVNGDYIVKPVNPPGAGKYFAWPVGMSLDQNTGAIDLTQSQTGMKYMIGFVALNRARPLVCLRRLNRRRRVYSQVQLRE